MRQELAHGDVVIATARPILRHLLANADQAIFSDEIIATVRGMMLHLSRQMLAEQAKQSGTNDIQGFIGNCQDDIALALLDDTDFLALTHSMTIEAQIASRLSQRSGIDPVLSPLLQELVASKDETVAADAMRVLAAQARFMQQQRRMELPLGELPEPLFERALQIFADSCAEHSLDCSAAMDSLRGNYDPRQRRIGKISRLIANMQHNAKRALEVDHAGLSIFITALGMAAEQERETIVLSLGENQCARLAISLRAAGLGQSAVEEQFLYIHPEITLPEGFDTIRSDRAAAMLSDAQIEGMH